MATVVYKCPGCEAPLRFDAASGMMVCDYCGSTFTVEEAKAGNMGKEDDDKAAMYQNEAGDYVELNEESSAKDKLAIYSHLCPSCGAELMGDAQTAATFCAYCGNPTLNEAVLTKTLKPKKVLPFKKTKEEAQKAFKEWGNKGFLTPKDFTSASTINKITGIYVPFWLYTSEATCDYVGKAEKVHRESHPNYDLEITEHYDIERKIDVIYDSIPADASEKMNDSLMDRLEPFDYSGMVDFDMAYLSGFLAEKYTYTDKDMRERVSKRIVSYAESAANDTVTGYTSHHKTEATTNIKWKRADYVMLPVWILNYKYNNEVYEFAMNGQTGRVVGKRPVDNSRRWIMRILSFLVGGIIGGILGGVFLSLIGFIIGFLLAGILTAIFFTNSKEKAQDTRMEANGKTYQDGKVNLLAHTDRFTHRTEQRYDHNNNR